MAVAAFTDLEKSGETQIWKVILLKRFGSQYGAISLMCHGNTCYSIYTSLDLKYRVFTKCLEMLLLCLFFFTKNCYGSAAQS